MNRLNGIKDVAGDAVSVAATATATGDDDGNSNGRPRCLLPGNSGNKQTRATTFDATQCENSESERERERERNQPANALTRKDPLCLCRRRMPLCLLPNTQRTKDQNVFYVFYFIIFCYV